MYTVARLWCASSVDESALSTVCRSLNEQILGCNASLNTTRTTVACSVSTSDIWSDHIDAMRQFVRSAREAISAAERLGIQFEFDVAISWKDLEGYNVPEYEVTTELMRDLVAANGSLTFSCYCGSRLMESIDDE
jgi:hypothetical protein